jgi:hypothetical protein
LERYERLDAEIGSPYAEQLAATRLPEAMRRRDEYRDR